MKRSTLAFIAIIAVIAVLCSCKKNDDGSGPHVEQDTLSTGWTKQVIPGDPLFFDVFFMQNTGFALSGKTIYRSTNGGTDWSVAHTTGNLGNMGMGSASNAIGSGFDVL